jgi:peptidoglycan/LPS O-acetylase OafA/YrhL
MRLSDVATGRDNNFNLIRLMAAFAVLISHSFPLSGVVTEPLQSALGMTLGTVAVDVFFVTSGFLVTASLFTRGSAVEYLCARVLRIFPALLVMIALTVLGLGVYFTETPLRSYFTSPLTYNFILKNSTLLAGFAVYLPGVFGHVPLKYIVNGSLWSMPWEVRFYGILALIWMSLRCTAKKRPQFFELAIISFAAFSCAWRMLGFYHFPFGQDFSHLSFMFFSGASFYVLKERVPLSWRLFCAFAIVLALSIVSLNLFFISYNLLMPYMLLFLAYVPSGFIRAYNRLGDYSYGLYIYAYPVQQSAAALHPGISPWQMALVSAPAALVLAVMSWYLVEKRALGLKSSLLVHSRRIFRW